MHKKLASVVAIAITILLGGCAGTPENLSGSEAQKEAEAGSAARQYEGTGETWSARYAMYLPENGGKMRGRLTVHYDEAGPAPIGELKYSYYGADIESGSGIMNVKKSPENAVYLLRDLTTTEYMPDEAGTVELILIWDDLRSETIRLEPKKP